MVQRREEIPDCQGRIVKDGCVKGEMHNNIPFPSEPVGNGVE
jgi:hypothetical protein